VSSPYEKTLAYFLFDLLGITRWSCASCLRATVLDKATMRKRRKKSKANEIIESAVKIIERKRASRCLPGRCGIQSRGTPAKNRDNGAHHEKERERERESSFFPRLFSVAPTLTQSRGVFVRTLLVIQLT